MWAMPTRTAPSPTSTPTWATLTPPQRALSSDCCTGFRGYGCRGSASFGASDCVQLLHEHVAWLRQCVQLLLTNKWLQLMRCRPTRVQLMQCLPTCAGITTGTLRA
jgi:hypothetical protein